MELLRALLLTLAFTAISIELAMAANYVVGGSKGGWDTSTDLNTWASSQKFLVGDRLTFQYAQNHDVSEVTKTDYDSCQTTNALQTDTSGATTFTLSSPGKRYFICGTPGHCAQGMKLEVVTLAASSTSSPASSPTPSPASSISPESPANSPVSTPEVSDLSPSPSGSPTSTPTVRSTESPSVNSPPPPDTTVQPSASSTNKLSFWVGLAVGFGLVPMLLVH